MGLGQQLAKIAVAGAVLNQDWKDGAIRHHQFTTDDRPNAMLASGY